MFYRELKKKIDQFVATLPDDLKNENYVTDKDLGVSVLNGFLWWLFPERKPKDLRSWEEWPLKKLIPTPSYPSEVDIELYGIQPPERCPPGDPMCPQPEEEYNG